MAFVNVLYIKDLGGYVVDTDSFPPPVVSLQAAYDGGAFVAESATQGGIFINTPIVPDTSVAGAAVSIGSAQDAYPLKLLHQGTDATTPALDIFVNAIVSVGCPAIALLMGFDADILRATDGNGQTSELFTLTAGAMTFPSDTAAGITRGVVQTGPSQAGVSAATLVIRGGEGDSDTTLAGPVSVGHAVNAGSEDGGFLCDPATGRMQLRGHDVNGLYTYGALGLVDNDDDGETNAAPANGDLSYRSEDSGNETRKHGFRAFRASAYGLVGRGAQCTFADDDLVGDAFTFPHGLDTPATIIQVYDSSGAQMTPNAAGPVLGIDADNGGTQATVSIDPAARPISGDWYITVIGF